MPLGWDPKGKPTSIREAPSLWNSSRDWKFYLNVLKAIKELFSRNLHARVSDRKKKKVSINKGDYTLQSYLSEIKSDKAIPK